MTETLTLDINVGCGQLIMVGGVITTCTHSNTIDQSDYSSHMYSIQPMTVVCSHCKAPHPLVYCTILPMHKIQTLVSTSSVIDIVNQKSYNITDYKNGL